MLDDGTQEIDPEAEMMAQQYKKEEEMNMAEDDSSSEEDDGDYEEESINESLINSFKQQLTDVQKVQQEQREQMNSLMMMPEKAKY